MAKMTQAARESMSRAFDEAVKAARAAQAGQKTEAEHRRDLIALRNRLTDEIDGRPASQHEPSTAELVARANEVMQKGKKLHEQLQGKKPSVDVSGNSEVATLAQPGEQRPAVTAEQYARGREVLDALPPGVYLKCSRCFKWQMGGDIRFESGGGFLCEKCA